MNPDQLRALAAVVDSGTFEAAARILHVTASAVSQRIRALETRVGQVLVRRALPCTATPAGDVLVRYARQLAVLEADAMSALRAGTVDGGSLALAVNADSVADWFTSVLAAAAGWPDTVLRIAVEDEGHSSRLLRSGEVIGAITSDPVAVQGCSVEPLGSMRYLPVAVPALRDRHRRGSGVDWARAPMVRFNAKDDLQHRVLRDRGITASPPEHRVPAADGHLAALRAGLGWGMLSVARFERERAAGTLVRIGSRDHLDVPLYWQVWRLRSPRIDRLSHAIREAARTGLR